MRKAREDAGLDQGQLAELIGVSRNTVSGTERRTNNPRKHVVMAWAMATGVPYEWLVTGEYETTPGPDGTEGDGSGDWIRTSNRPINSRMLCR